MGNCLRSNRVMAQDPEIYSHNLPEKKVEAEDRKPAVGSAMAKPKTAAEARTGVKKVVRFKLEEDDQNPAGAGGEEAEIVGDTGGGSGGVLRIKVVVSQKELKQILKDRENNLCSVEELIAELKVKGRTSTISDTIERPRSHLESTIPDSEDLQ